MAWKPKTIMGKILKGATIGGGALLGVTVLGGGVKGIIKGTGALIGAKTSIAKLKSKTTGLKESAAKLLTGKTKEERTLINNQREEARAGLHKLQMVEDLVNAGATPEAARAKMGLAAEELTTYEGEPVQKAGFGGPVLYIGLALAALFFLPKLLKRK